MSSTESGVTARVIIGGPDILRAEVAYPLEESQGYDKNARNLMMRISDDDDRWRCASHARALGISFVDDDSGWYLNETRIGKGSCVELRAR